MCVCVYVCIIEKHSFLREIFWKQQSHKQLRQVTTNKPTSKEQIQNSMNKKWEKVAIERLKNVIASMGRVVNPWGTYPPTLGPKRAEMDVYVYVYVYVYWEA